MKAKKVGKVFLIILAVIVALALLFIAGYNIYQKISYREFNKVSEKEFKIPGLSDGFVPQGITWVENDGKEGMYLVCGYMSDGSASRIYMTNGKSGKELKQSFVSLFTNDGKADHAHAGGISVFGDFVYIATGHEINVYSLSELLGAKEKSTDLVDAYVEKSRDSEFTGVIEPIGTFNPQTGPAFVHVEDGYLFVGEFYIAEDYETPESHHMTTDSGDYQQAIMTVYVLSKDAELGLLEKRPVAAFSITDKAQGMCFVKDDKGETKMLISTSYSVASSHIKVYDNPMKSYLSLLAGVKDASDGTFTTDDGDKVPLFYVDSAHLEKDWVLAPMSEELLYKDGKVYIMCESACKKYMFGNLTGARNCYSFRPY